MASILRQCSIFVAISLSLWSLTLGQDTGIGTFNDPPYTPSACYGNEDLGVMVAAVSDELWKGGAACGRMYQVTCIGEAFRGTPHPCIDGSSVTVKITDYCPGCKGTFDLSKESFSTIADPNAGGIKISYQQV